MGVIGWYVVGDSEWIVIVVFLFCIMWYWISLRMVVLFGWMVRCWLVNVSVLLLIFMKLCIVKLFDMVGVVVWVFVCCLFWYWFGEKIVVIVMLVKSCVCNW